MKQYDETKLDYKTKAAIEYILEADAAAKLEVAKYKAIAETNYKITPFKPYVYYSREFTFAEPSGYYVGESKRGSTLGNIYYGDKIRLVDSVDVIRAAKAEDEAIYKENILIAQANTKTYENLMSLIKNMGIETRHKDPKSRKRFPDTVDKDFVGELKGSCRCYAPSMPNWDGFIKQVEDREIKVKQEAEKLEKEKAAKEKLNKRDKLIISLLVKYNLSFDVAIPSPSDLIDVLLEKDKYLRLAHYLEKNRGDWSDGCNYAKTGLNGFTVETMVDQQIHDDISSHVNDWDGDGRVFRDCQWNYRVIFGMVTPDIYADYLSVMEYVERY